MSLFSCNKNSYKVHPQSTQRIKAYFYVLSFHFQSLKPNAIRTFKRIKLLRHIEFSGSQLRKEGIFLLHYRSHHKTITNIKGRSHLCGLYSSAKFQKMTRYSIDLKSPASLYMLKFFRTLRYLSFLICNPKHNIKILNQSSRLARNLKANNQLKCIRIQAYNGIYHSKIMAELEKFLEQVDPSNLSIILHLIEKNNNNEHIFIGSKTFERIGHLSLKLAINSRLSSLISSQRAQLKNIHSLDLSIGEIDPAALSLLAALG